MTVLTDIPFSLSVQRLLTQLHLGAETEETAEFSELVELAQRVGRPKAAYRETYITDRAPDAVQIDNVWFTSRALARKLAEVQRVFVAVATCGSEMDQANPAAGDPLLEYARDLLKMDLLNAARISLTSHIRRRYQLALTASMSPGSGDASIWPIEQQQQLFGLLPGYEEKLGVRLTDSCLMIPNKTISCVIFRASEDFRTCVVCQRENCPSRRAAFDAAEWAALQQG